MVSSGGAPAAPNNPVRATTGGDVVCVCVCGVLARVYLECAGPVVQDGDKHMSFGVKVMSCRR